MYLHRHLESILREAVTQFPVVALLGPRQVGKSTLLLSLFKDTHRYLSFDDLSLDERTSGDSTSENLALFSSSDDPSRKARMGNCRTLAENLARKKKAPR